MNFYYRSVPDGRREIVCMRCFLTIGTAVEMAEIRRIEESHQCAATRIPAMQPIVPPGAPPKTITQPHVPFSIDSLLSAKNGIRTRRMVRSALLLVAAAVFLYLVPNEFEFMALRHWNPYVSSVLPGDVLGCAFLCFVLRKVKAGISLYCVLTAFEACCLGVAHHAGERTAMVHGPGSDRGGGCDGVADTARGEQAGQRVLNGLQVSELKWSFAAVMHSDGSTSKWGTRRNANVNATAHAAE